MIFELKEDIPDKGLIAGEKGYGDLVSIGPDKFRHMVKFTANANHKSIIMYFDIDYLEVTDESSAGVDILGDVFQ